MFFYAWFPALAEAIGHLKISEKYYRIMKTEITPQYLNMLDRVIFNLLVQKHLKFSMPFIPQRKISRSPYLYPILNIFHIQGGNFSHCSNRGKQYLKGQMLWESIYSSLRLSSLWNRPCQETGSTATLFFQDIITESWRPCNFLLPSLILKSGLS